MANQINWYSCLVDYISRRLACNGIQWATDHQKNDYLSKLLFNMCRKFEFTNSADLDMYKLDKFSCHDVHQVVLIMLRRPNISRGRIISIFVTLGIVCCHLDSDSIFSLIHIVAISIPVSVSILYEKKNTEFVNLVDIFVYVLVSFFPYFGN
jgi:hypothetical protein